MAVLWKQPLEPVFMHPGDRWVRQDIPRLGVKPCCSKSESPGPPGSPEEPAGRTQTGFFFVGVVLAAATYRVTRIVAVGPDQSLEPPTE